MQGMGVSVPRAAAVAAAVGGKAKERHKPNGAKFTIDWWSLMLAWGCLAKYMVRVGNTVNLAGLVPIVHFIIAPEQTYESGISIGFYHGGLDVYLHPGIERHLLIGFGMMCLGVLEQLVSRLFADGLRRNL